MTDFLGTDDDALQGCPRCSDRFSEKNYVSFSRVPVSCYSCCPPKKNDDWKAKLKTIAEQQIAAERKVNK